MMDRRTLLVAAILSPLAAFSAGVPTRQVRIGYLSVASVDRDRAWLDALREGLKEYGYVEGSNLTLITRHADGYSERLAAAAVELANSKIDLFVVYGAPAAVLAAQRAAPTTPIVMTVAVDPVRNKLVSSLAHPGGNVTGLSDLHAGMVGKRLQMLKELLPGITRVAVLMNRGAAQSSAQYEDLKAAAATMGIKLMPMRVGATTRAELEREWAALGNPRPAALLLIPDGGTDRNVVSKFALEHNLPSISTVKEWAEAGCTLSYGTSFADLWRRSAAYVDKILKGAKPGDLPIEQPTKFELVVNMKTAKALGIKIPQSIMLQADKVIE